MIDNGKRKIRYGDYLKMICLIFIDDKITIFQNQRIILNACWQDELRWQSKPIWTATRWSQFNGIREKLLHRIHIVHKSSRMWIKLTTSNILISLASICKNHTLEL